MSRNYFSGNEAQTWPLIRSVQLQGPWSVLSSGAVLVDLPVSLFMSVTSCLSITTYVCDSLLLSSSSSSLFYSQFFLILFPFVYTNNHHKRVSEMPMLHVLVLPKGTFNIAISEFHLSIHMFIESLILIDNTILLNSIQQSFNPTILLFSLLESQPFKNSPLATTNRIWVVAPIKRAVDDGTAKVSYSTKSE